MTAHTWWWVGLTDQNKPRGQQAIGAVIVSATEEAQAGLQVRAMMGREYAHCVLFMGEVPAEHGDPPPHYVGRFLNPREAELLVQTWPHAGGRLATGDEIRRAILDDNAQRGDPLFIKPRGRR